MKYFLKVETSPTATVILKGETEDPTEVTRLVEKLFGRDEVLPKMVKLVYLPAESAITQKIEAIKIIRTLTNLGLKESKDMVEATGETFVLQGSQDVLLDAKRQLHHVGMVTVLRPIETRFGRV